VAQHYPGAGWGMGMRRKGRAEKREKGLLSLRRKKKKTLTNGGGKHPPEKAIHPRAMPSRKEEVAATAIPFCFGGFSSNGKEQHKPTYEEEREEGGKEST